MARKFGLQRAEMRRSVSEQAALICVARGNDRLLALERAGLTQVVEMQRFLGACDLAAGQALGVDPRQTHRRATLAPRCLRLPGRALTRRFERLAQRRTFDGWIRRRQIAASIG